MLPALAQLGPRGDGIWQRNAYYGEAQTFDPCVGHQPQTGQYHYHANPICLRAQLGDNVQTIQSRRNGTIYREKAAPWMHSPILGWAFDGYPIYGPYAYSEPQNPASAVKRMKSSFRLRGITQRTSLPDWALAMHPGVSQQLSASQYGPPVNSDFPRGRYLEDYEYVEGLGDLDVYNGRVAVTPDFPSGTYAYYVTIDDDGVPAFPYVIGLQYRGTAAGGTIQTIPSGAQDHFNSGALTGSASSLPLLGSWATKNSLLPAQVISAFDPSAGPKTTWPTDVPAGARTTGGVSTPTPADTQRIRCSDSAVYINANGLASYPMGPWFDALQPGGVFGNFPSNAAYQMQVPRAPSVPSTKTATGLGPVGLWVNGVAVFNVLDGASYSNAQAADVGGGLVSPSAILVSAASFERSPVAAGSLLTAFPIFGSTIATSTAAAESPAWPASLGGAMIIARDSAGVDRTAVISYASPGQVNFRLPETMAVGYGTVTISAGGKSASSGINVVAVYPNLFFATTDGLAAGYLTRVRGGQQTTETLYQTAGSTLAPVPVDLGPETDQVYLVIFGSGLDTARSATVTIGGVEAVVAYAGPQGTYGGLDQYNILLPGSLAGKGKVDVVLRAGGKSSNAVHFTVR